MKHFLLTNWYHLSISFSLLLFAFGFVVLALKYNTAKAGDPLPNQSEYFQAGQHYESGGKLWRIEYSSQSGYSARKIVDFEEWK